MSLINNFDEWVWKMNKFGINMHLAKFIGLANPHPYQWERGVVEYTINRLEGEAIFDPFETPSQFQNVLLKAWKDGVKLALFSGRVGAVHDESRNIRINTDASEVERIAAILEAIAIATGYKDAA